NRGCWLQCHPPIRGADRHGGEDRVFSDWRRLRDATSMKKVGDSFELSATDLVGYLNCHHLAGLDRAVANGTLSKPKVWDPLLQILSERGAAHEQSYIEHLTTAGLDVVRIDCVEVSHEAVRETR